MLFEAHEHIIKHDCEASLMQLPASSSHAGFSNLTMHWMFCSLGKRYLHTRLKSGGNIAITENSSSSCLLVCGELFGQRFRSTCFVGTTVCICDHNLQSVMASLPFNLPQGRSSELCVHDISHQQASICIASIHALKADAKACQSNSKMKSSLMLV